ncbi:hypothetical protein RF11_13624 [Thelohanellus kitauei]|uniref:Uncharacterized protein n=1 Tax=Thelohanellus kitauei TaxID=669202 RepID=A0A0C2MLW2_THEKT|nr:hypothetical protein RF11_13624 [Thelohanellus kitauei]
MNRVFLGSTLSNINEFLAKVTTVPREVMKLTLVRDGFRFQHNHVAFHDWSIPGKMTLRYSPFLSPEKICFQDKILFLEEMAQGMEPMASYHGWCILVDS